MSTERFASITPALAKYYAPLMDNWCCSVGAPQSTRTRGPTAPAVYCASRAVRRSATNAIASHCGSQHPLSSQPPQSDSARPDMCFHEMRLGYSCAIVSFPHRPATCSAPRHACCSAGALKSARFCLIRQLEVGQPLIRSYAALANGCVHAYA